MQAFYFLLVCGAVLFHSSRSQGTLLASIENTVNGRLTVNESAGVLEVCVVLNGSVTTNVNATVRLATLQANDARAGEDYVLLNTVLTFTQNTEPRRCVNITIIDDTLEEGLAPQEFRLQLTNIVGVVIPNDLVPVEILDDDVVTIGFSQPIFEAKEGDGTIEVCARIVDGRIESGVDSISVGLSLSMQQNPTDLILPSTTSLMFSGGTTGSVCTDVNIIDDTFIEDTEFFTVSLMQVRNFKVRFTNNSAMLRIEDNDAATVRVTGMLTRDVLEGNSSVAFEEVCVQLDDERAGLDRNVTIKVSTNDDGSATGGVDFIQLGSDSTLVIPAGTRLQDSERLQCLNITIIGDDQRENDETFTVTFTLVTPDEFNQGGSNVNSVNVTIRIIDDGDVRGCRTLVDPSNGDVRESGNGELNSTASYFCNSPFQLFPRESQTRVCQPNDWNGTDPMCIAVCPMFRLVDGAIQLTRENFTAGTVANYICNANFELVGKGTAVCQENGFWSAEVPICRAVRCEILQNPMFGGVQTDLQNSVGSRATYFCNSNFRLTNGDQFRMCLEDGNWTGMEPECSGATGVINQQGMTTVLLTILFALTGYILL